MDLLTTLAQDRKHLYTPLGDSRHRSVPCAGPFCRRTTWNVCGRCDEHCPHDAPSAVVTSPGSAPAPVLLGGAS